MSVNVQSTAEENELTAKQEALIAALLSLPTIVAAAQATGINEKTARRWLKLPHVQAAYKLAQHSLFDEKLSELRDGVGTAIACLKRNMQSEDTPASTQVRAAQIWLEQAVALHKTQELEQKISELEELIKAQAGSR